MRSEIVKVTPELAAEWISKNSRNRTVKKAVVEAYAADMLSGNWTETHQGIAFFEDKTLADGQHRLQAVIKSGVSVDMLVTIGLKDSSSMAIDTHKKRSVEDNLTLSGHSEVTREIIATINWIFKMFQNKNVKWGRSGTPSQVLSFFDAHKKDVLTCNEITGTGRGLPAPARAAILSAIMCEKDVDKLERFSLIARGAMPSGDAENAPYRLREYMLRNPSGGVTQRIELYKLTENAISKFCKSEPVGHLRVKDSLIYIKKLDMSLYGF